MIRGRVMEEDTRPVPFASISVLNQPGGIVSDPEGNFALRARRLRPGDTLLISSVGHELLKIPANRVYRNAQFILKRDMNRMKAVTVRTFKNADMVGARSENVGYYRSWRTDSTGGEIGRAVVVPHQEYQVAKVWFKIYSTCDTNIIRLHIRDNVWGLPGEELLPFTVTKTIYKAIVANKAYEFDLEPYNLILKNKNIFVGFEILKGTGKDGSSCSCAYVGSDPGIYIYKANAESQWLSMDDYAIYMRVQFKYDD